MIKVASLLSQALSLVNRNAFERLVREHGTERGSKGFDSWSQFVSLLFAQLAGANSLREISDGLASCMG